MYIYTYTYIHKYMNIYMYFKIDMYTHPSLFINIYQTGDRCALLSVEGLSRCAL